MFLAFTGIVDIVLIVLALIMIIVGFKKGFMKKILSHVGVLLIIGISFFYATGFAAMLTEHEIIAPTINGNIMDKLNSIQGIDPQSLVTTVLRETVKLPGFIVDIIGNQIGNDVVVADGFPMVANFVTKICMTGIAFLILLVGLLLILGLLKLIVTVLRSSKIIRFLDGMLGIVYHLVLYAILVMVLLWIVNLIHTQEWFQPAFEWLSNDMKLGTGEFSIAGYLYENNILINITNLFM